MDTVQSLAVELLKLPSAQAEKQDIKKLLTELYNDWDDICQQVYMYMYMHIYKYHTHYMHACTCTVDT